MKEESMKQRGPQAATARIDAFCEKIGVDLPMDYRQFLLDYNGVIFRGEPCFVIPGINKTVELNTLYGLDFNTPQGTCLEKNYHYNFNYGLDGTTLMIGDCYTGGVGGLFIMLLTEDDGTGGIYACDLFSDDFVFEESTEDNNTFKVANSFSEFMANLKYPE
ncbi:SMI1/KNR4 family protein [Paenibacillus mesotrionivorans]|uniref:SMI1/KNR4 family protein n=1 Tax=Paenibacillus mesotrionivorans TaxID=3160968 RepID=A0ACC7P3E6_9BACL